MTRQLYSLAEVAHELNIGQTTLRHLINRGEIVTVQIGRRRLVRHADLQFFVDGLQAAAPPSNDHSAKPIRLAWWRAKVAR